MMQDDLKSIQMIKATIVDDEPYCCEALATLLERYCPDVKILDICYSAAAALQSISEHRPQILFLDIEMPHMNGFELLQKIPEINFELIFTTSYDQYAIKAIRFSALDYLLKPIDREELQKAVHKAVQRMLHPHREQIEILLQKLSHPTIPINKIAIPTVEGLQIIQQLFQHLYLNTSKAYFIAMILQKNMSLRCFTKVFPDNIFADGNKITKLF